MRATLAFALSCSLARAWAGHAPVAPFTANHGQWPAQVLYRTHIPGGTLFIEGNTLTYSLYRGGPMTAHAHDGPGEVLRQHAYRVHFEGAAMAQGEGADPQGYYENFFIGNDPARWGTRCPVFGLVRANGLYPGIDLRVDGRNGLKYDLLVAPGADAGLIALRFEGPAGLELRDGRLVVHTSVGDVIEEAPVAYQEGPLGRKGVRCRYRLRGDRLTFELPDGYDHALPLVIDPVLTFGSFSGSTGNNFGFTATYDAAGHLYGGGIVFDTGYPITSGVLDPTFNGGTIDIGITKFSPDGTSLVWSTYLGGSGSESPHSLVVNSNEELYVFGSTGSPDIPTTANAYDNTFNGGTEIHGGPLNVGWAGLSGGYGYGHLQGTDILVAHFTADATALIGCTYVGGTQNDGVNNVLPLAHNYGDAFRGEIALDPQGRPVIATSTASPDIPVSPGAPQAVYGGGAQDAYLFRMDPQLSTLEATFYGGSGKDSGYGVQFDSNGQIFLSGGTTSTDLPMTGNSWHSTAPGQVDGYVARFSANGSTMLSSTYVGTSGYDQCYFVQLNTANEVYVVGQTHGSYPISPGKYANAGSSQFIQKMDHDLSTSLWSTVIGNGQSDQDISPSAFLVSDCGQIYFSGWGGEVNGYAQSANSTTTGMPVTSDAFQSTTDGSDFYLMVLEAEAAGLSYGTYFGGGISEEHVDGGTSRFDKNGTVYQAVCAGCGGHSDFPTTPNAWSTENNNSCNLGVFKFDLARLTAEVHIDGPSEVCIPGTVQFINESTGGTTYAWTFGDGGTSSDFEPQHTYTEAGTYTVIMILTDSNGCAIGDTTDIDVTGDVLGDASVDPLDTLCPGLSTQLHAHGGSTYNWSPPDFLDDPSSSSPTADPPDDMHYVVAVTDACGTDSVHVDLVVEPVHGNASPDTVICVGDTVALVALGGTAFTWSPGSSLSATDVADPLAFPSTTTDYIVHISVQQGCEATDTVTVTVESASPVPTTDDVAVCLGDSVHLNVGGGDRAQWEDATITDPHATDPSVAPVTSRWYRVHVINACADVLDSVFVDVQHVEAAAWPDTLVCPNEPVALHASGGTLYSWSPSGSLSSASAPDVIATPTSATDYRVIVSNALGCADTAVAHIAVYPTPHVYALGDAIIDYGDATPVSAMGNGTLHWSPSSSLDCDSCAQALASPITSTTYVVTLTDTNGCKAIDDVVIYVNGSLFVPNTFTPNGDGINDGFFAIATEVRTFHLYVFNRWGERIYDANSLDKPWDGTYQGVDSPIDTYVWRVDLTELSGNKRTVFGHVNLIR